MRASASRRERARCYRCKALLQVHLLERVWRELRAGRKLLAWACRDGAICRWRRGPERRQLELF